MSELVKCATCKTEKPFSEMQTCMQADREYSVCDMPCMIKFYKGEIKPDIVITPDLEEMVRLGMNPKEYELHKINLELTEQLAKANERVEELQDALVDDAKAKAMLNKLTIENGELNIKASGNIFHVFCETFVETFKGSGATNYLVAEFNSEELGAFTVTMQRSEGLTVHQKLSEANERVAELENQVGFVAGLFNNAVDTCYESKEARDKFAIEKKIEALENCIKDNEMNNEEIDAIIIYVDDVKSDIEQLRKEQE